MFVAQVAKNIRKANKDSILSKGLLSVGSLCCKTRTQAVTAAAVRRDQITARKAAGPIVAVTVYLVPRYISTYIYTGVTTRVKGHRVPSLLNTRPCAWGREVASFL